MYSTDLTSAFDLLRPALLIKNLLDLNMPLLFIRVISDNLSNRCSFVDINGTHSHIKAMPFGCVQGSSLGPFLFNIYCRDLNRIITSTLPTASVVTYADDAYVMIPDTNNNTLHTVELAENLFTKHSDWLKSIGMECNIDKTDVIIFGNNTQHININLQGNLIPTKNNIKVLGLTFEKTSDGAPMSVS